MDIISNNYLPGDQRLIEQIVRELKSQGIFDQFRRECISDVDTKPAYQNLRQRVESSVSGFLTSQTWSPEMNKNQVREMLRKNIYESGFLETGVERIVDQVVNPKINSVFLPKVEDVVYKFLGIEKPVKTNRSISTPLGIGTIQDLLPKDLEAISPEMPDDHDDLIEDTTEDVKMDEEPSMNSVPNSTPGKVVIEENSIDSQSSSLSGLTSHNSNQSQKQDSVLSVNGSENRVYHTSSESRSNMDFENVQSNDNFSDVNSKIQQSVDGKMDVAVTPPEDESKLEEINTSEKENVSHTETTSIDTPVKSKESSDKKKERHHSSSDKSKSRSDRDKDKSKTDKYKKEDKDVSKEQKSEKYRIPKLSDKKKAEKDSKSREKNDKSREREKDDKNRSRSSDKDNKVDKKSDKDKKSKHSSETDKSRNEDSGKSKRDKHERGEKKYSKDDRKSSSSSKHRDSSSKDRHREKDRDGKNKNEESSDKNKNGHRSSSSSNNSKDKHRSKYKKEEDKSRSSRKKDEKDDKKKKRSSKDDHYSSKDKRNERRSSDRDSDDASCNKKTPVVPRKNAETTQHLSQESSSSNMEESTGESGNSDQVEGNNEENIAAVQLNKRKFRLPKFASNLGEAMKIMKIRKQIKKLENMDTDSPEMKSLMLEIELFSKDINWDKKETGNSKENDFVQEEKKEEKECSKNVSVDINDFISSSSISMAKWNSLEAKFMEELGKIDYDSYESPYVDDEESVVEKKVEEGKYEDKEQICEVDKIEVHDETSGDNVNLEVDGEVYLDTSEIVSEIVLEDVNPDSSNEILINQSVTEVIIEETQPETDENLERSPVQKLVEKPISIDKPKLLNGSIEHEIPEKPELIQQTKNVTLSCQTPPIESSKNEENPSDTETNHFNKKAVVILEKNSITEAMIERNGEIDERFEVLEIEKENLETNKIVDENREVFEETDNVSSVSVLEEEGDKRKYNNKSMNKDVPKGFNQVLTEKNGKRKSRTFSSGVGNSLTTNEDVCRSLEPSENVRALNILKCLIKDIEDNILHIMERMRMNDHTIVKKITMQNGKRKRRGQKSDISNNNVEVSASKRMKTKNLPATVRPKRITELNNKEAAENDADKLLDAKLSLPLSPDNNENSADKKGDSQNTRITKCTRQSGIAVGDVEKIADSKKSTPVKKCKIPGEILSEKKNGAKQRYSCEDLYKPRIFLRRSGKNTKKS